MNNKPFSPVEAMQATQDAHDKAFGVTPLPTAEKTVRQIFNDQHTNPTKWEVTPLPSVDEEHLGLAHEAGWYESDELVVPYSSLTQDRDLAYTSLIEGIEGMSMPIGSEGLEKQMYDQALSDIIEKVVKPLYNKE